MNYYWYLGWALLSFINMCVITLRQNRELRSRAMYVYAILSLIPGANMVIFFISLVFIIGDEIVESLLNKKGKVVFKLPSKDE